jgi:small subunit ribosomal protein S17
MADDETTEDAAAKAAAADAEQALEAVEAEAATELPAGDASDGTDSTDSADAAASAPAPATAAATATAAPAVKVEEPEDGTRPNRRKVREGIVVSDAMTATVIVAVVERVRHPRYGKTVQRTKRLYVHDADDSAKVGDRVRVQECRPLSKLKRWRLTEVVERAR